MGITRSELANLVGHLNSMRTAIDTMQRHLDESQQTIFAMMREHGLAEDPRGLTRAEEHGT